THTTAVHTHASSPRPLVRTSVRLQHCNKSMPPLRQQSPRVVINKLHEAARDGSTWLTAAILSTGSIDIDERDSSGGTPLMHAICNDHPSVVSILLSKGASVSAINDDGNTALHLSAFK
ncbi:unnamed protein product, partial [Ectocarpus sp. 12 AP-2014]